MKYAGINYDTGTETVTGKLTREQFDPGIVASEISIIKNDLHCNAIRISGKHIDRIVRASEIALRSGLTVFFSASLKYDNQQNTLGHIIQSAIAAEKLRNKYPQIIFVTECELSLFVTGFIKGDTGNERIKKLFSPVSILKNTLGMKRKYNTRLNVFLLYAVEKIRKEFKGQITYASGPWEKINWKLFDLIGVDLYRSAYNSRVYNNQLQNYKRYGKPLCITEFGCCAYKRADNKGAMGWAIIDWNKDRPELKEEHVRDEDVQANYLLELLDIFDKEKVFASFVFTFISYNYLYNDNPRYDLDMGSFGIVRAMENKGTGYYKNLLWLPKKAFTLLSQYYADYFKHKNESTNQL